MMTPSASSTVTSTPATPRIARSICAALDSSATAISSPGSSLGLALPASGENAVRRVGLPYPSRPCEGRSLRDLKHIDGVLTPANRDRSDRTRPDVPWVELFDNAVRGEQARAVLLVQMLETR